MAKKMAVVDGANIAYIEQSRQGDPKVSNILAVRAALEKRGYEPIIIVDASLIYEIDDQAQLEALIDDQVVRQVPAQTDADYFIIESAEEHKAIIVSNDQFEPYVKEHPWIKERRVPLMIINGEVELYEPDLKEDRE